MRKQVAYVHRGVVLNDLWTGQELVFSPREQDRCTMNGYNAPPGQFSVRTSIMCFQTNGYVREQLTQISFKCLIQWHSLVFQIIIWLPHTISGIKQEHKNALLFGNWDFRCFNYFTVWLLAQLGSYFSWGTSSMGHGKMPCGWKLIEDTKGKDPCCSVSIHDVLVNWLETGVISSSLL